MTTLKHCTCDSRDKLPDRATAQMFCGLHALTAPVPALPANPRWYARQIADVQRRMSRVKKARKSARAASL